MKQAHFLASFLLSILFLFPEFSPGQSPPCAAFFHQQAGFSQPLGSGLQHLSLSGSFLPRGAQPGGPMEVAVSQGMA